MRFTTRNCAVHCLAALMVLGISQGVYSEVFVQEEVHDPLAVSLEAKSAVSASVAMGRLEALFDDRRKGGGGAKSGGSSSSGSKSSFGGGGSSGSSGYSKVVNSPPTSTSSKTGTYRTTTSTGSTARVGTYTSPYRPTTAAAMSSTFTALPVRYAGYGSRGPNLRPFYIAAGAVAAASLMSGRRECSGDRYRFGNSCRPCSKDACPIGQYRTECDPYNDGYCTACTGLPDNSYWITPGNGNNCKYESCKTDGAPCEFCEYVPQETCPSKDPIKGSAVLSFFAEVPMSAAEFNSNSQNSIKTAIASVGSGAGVTPEDVTITSIQEATLEASDVSAGKARRYIENEGGAGVRRLLQVEGGASRRLLQNVNSTNATGNATTTPAPTTPAPACAGAVPEHDKYTVAVIEVVSTEVNVEKAWAAITEQAINEKLSEDCRPPVTLGYFDSATSTTSASLLLAMLSSVVSIWGASKF